MVELYKSQGTVCCNIFHPLLSPEDYLYRSASVQFYR